MKTYPIIANRKLYFAFSGVLIAVSIAALIVWGLKIGIDFTGGTSIDLRFTKNRPTAAEVQKALEPMKLGEVMVSPVGDNDATVRTKPLDDAGHKQFLDLLNTAFTPKGSKDAALTELQFQTVGPVIGSELASKTIWAIVLAWQPITETTKTPRTRCVRGGK